MTILHKNSNSNFAELKPVQYCSNADWSLMTNSTYALDGSRGLKIFPVSCTKTPTRHSQKVSQWNPLLAEKDASQESMFKSLPSKSLAGADYLVLDGSGKWAKAPLNLIRNKCLTEATEKCINLCKIQEYYMDAHPSTRCPALRNWERVLRARWRFPILSQSNWTNK